MNQHKKITPCNSTFRGHVLGQLSYDIYSYAQIETIDAVQYYHLLLNQWTHESRWYHMRR
jgi:hypothetical protein